MLPLGQLDDQDAGRGAKDSEIDFVIAHPDEGTLCLEVEGGGLECNHGEWCRIKKGETERMKDPFKQTPTTATT